MLSLNTLLARALSIAALPPIIGPLQAARGGAAAPPLKKLLPSD
jgi:hypothetical protein